MDALTLSTSSKQKKITLEEYLRENVEFLEFKKNDEFWKNLKLSSQIPIEGFIEKDPLVPIVGKKEEIELGKILNYKGMLVQLYRVKRNEELVILSLEYETLKKKGFRNYMEDRERELTKSGLDWEKAIEKIIREVIYQQGDRKDLAQEEVEEEIFKRRKQLIKEEILNQWPQIFFKTKIDWKRISEKIRDEIPTPPILYFEGPVGSGKSFLQRQLAKSYLKLAKEAGVEFFDYMAVRNPTNKDEAEIVRLPTFDGKELINYDEEVKERKAKRKRYAKNALFTTLGASALYFSLTIGKKLVSEPWGLGIGVNPLLDFVWWVINEKNMKVIQTVLFGSMGFHSLMLFKNWARQGDDTRPEILALSTDNPPVYVGRIGLENLIGKYNKKPREPPQNGFEVKPELLAADGKPLIWEQIGEQSEDVQSLLGQIIQEREIDIANNGSNTRDYFTIMYMGSNPHKEGNIIAPIKDRVNLGKPKYVKNEIERTTMTERELFCFFEYYRLKSGKVSPMDISAMEEAKKISITLSEGKDTIIINRRYLSILDTAFDLAKKNNDECVTAKHVKEALVMTKSTIERLLENRRELHYNKAPIIKDTNKIGKVNFVPLLTDENLISDTSNPAIKKEMAEENGLGYVTSIYAYGSNKPGLNVVGVTSQNYTEIQNYRDNLESLAHNSEIDLSKNGITIDLSNLITPDASSVLAAYIAMKSFADKVPIRQDIGVASTCNLKGELITLNKLNKRVLDTGGTLENYLVSRCDLEKRIEPSFYPSITFLSAATSYEAFNLMKG